MGAFVALLYVFVALAVAEIIKAIFNYRPKNKISRRR